MADLTNQIAYLSSLLARIETIATKHTAEIIDTHRNGMGPSPVDGVAATVGGIVAEIRLKIADLEMGIEDFEAMMNPAPQPPREGSGEDFTPLWLVTTREIVSAAA